MRKFLISASLSCGLLTSSCTTLTPGVDPITGGNIAAEITQVQALATQVELLHRRQGSCERFYRRA